MTGYEIFNEILKHGYFKYNDPNFYSNTGMFILVIVGCAVISYLLGSINCGVILSKLKYGQDIRTQGSGNAGATNMMRTYGKGAAILTFIGDMLKTALAVAVGYFALGYYGAYAAGLFCVIGHAYPIFFQFKGGKGVVCISTMCLLTEPVVFLIMLIIFLVILFGYKMVSLASVMIMLTYPLVLSMAGFAGVYGLHILIAAVTALFIVFLHRKNIARIYNHTEAKITFGKKKEETDNTTTENSTEEENIDENGEK